MLLFSLVTFHEGDFVCLFVCLFASKIISYLDADLWRSCYGVVRVGLPHLHSGQLQPGVHLSPPPFLYMYNKIKSSFLMPTCLGGEGPQNQYENISQCHSARESTMIQNSSRNQNKIKEVLATNGNEKSYIRKVFQLINKLIILLGIENITAFLQLSKVKPNKPHSDKT